MRLKESILSACLALLLILLPLSCTQYQRHALAKDLGGLRVADYDHIVEITRTALKERRGDVTLRFFSKNDAQEHLSDLGHALMEDALAHTGEGDGGDYLRYQLGGWELHYASTAQGNRYFNELYILPDYYTDSKQEEWVSAECGRILSTLPLTELSDTERAYCLYAYVCENIRYDMADKNFPARHLRSTAFSALKYKTAACQGYAVLIYRLFNEAGIDCRVLCGDAVYEGQSEYHAWNSFCLDGEWYFLDATWGSMEEDKDKYFMKSAEEFSDHVAEAAP